MTNKYPPASIVLVTILLSLTALFGSIAASAGLGRWRVLGGASILVWAVLHAVILAIIPTLAVVDIWLRRPSGRYVALVPMLWLFGLCLRPFIELTFINDFSLQPFPFTLWALSTCSVYVLGTLIFKLAYGKQIGAFLKPEGDDRYIGSCRSGLVSIRFQ